MTKVAILWHLHQPHYGDPHTGAQMLPWVRLHALKDYLGMVEILREFPDVRLTFNLVPSLVRQIDALVRGEAGDRYLDLSRKPASATTLEEREFIIANFFHAQRARMIERWPRYRELLARREDAGLAAGVEPWQAAAARFSEAEIRDLQVWQRLTWVDRLYADDRRVRALVEKGRGYTEEDKQALADVEWTILRQILPAYRAAAARGQVELSTSPFYHPILPLLCDSDLYARFDPEARVDPPFRYPEDASAQVARAMACHEAYFGAPPRGLWPPEGAVSDAVVPLAAAHGLRWIATDEIILARTLGTSFTRDGAGTLDQPETLYRPYRVRTAGAEVSCLFRDHVLSDLIGFTYSSWPAVAAAEDLVRRLVEGGRRHASRTGGEEAVIGIALDGENAWEHYEDQGRPFLRTFYRLLADHPEIRTVTMSDATAGATATLDGLFPGSWAGGDFSIWIGHEDDRRAWGQLSTARAALGDAEAGGQVPAAALERAREHLMIAEGSDWFWWYGDDHSSDQDLEFDTLFRGHVQAVYAALGQPAPEHLAFTNITVGAKAVEIVEPTNPLRPALDGRGDEAGWAGAGFPRFRQRSGTMRQSAPDARGRVKAIHFGFGDGHLYLRVDIAPGAAEALSAGTRVVIRFLAPLALRLELAANGSGGVTATWSARRPDGSWAAHAGAPVLHVAAGDVLEAAIPLSTFGTPAEDGRELSFYVTLERGDVELGRYPGPVPVKTRLP